MAYCIYQITNKINGHRYIGQHKYSDERNPMGQYIGSGVLLKKAYKKYGIENFSTEILYKRIRDKSTVNAMEIWAIEKYKPEYNIAKGGTGGVTGYGHKSTSGQHWYNNGVEDVMAFECPAGYQLGRCKLPNHRTEESKLKTSQSLKGHSGWNKGKPAWNKGKSCPEDTRKKISETLKSKSEIIFTDNYKKKHSEIMKEWWRKRKWEH